MISAGEKNFDGELLLVAAGSDGEDERGKERCVLVWQHRTCTMGVMCS